MQLLDIFFPKFCLGCGKLGSYVCQSCLNKTKQLLFLKCPECEKPAIDGKIHPKCVHKVSLDGVYSFFPYTGVIQKAVKAIKYRFAFKVIECIVSQIPQSKFSYLKKILDTKKCIIIPIPLHKARLRFRGFNQAELIGRSLSKALDIPMETDVVVRKNMTSPQVDMRTRGERIKNMKEAFSIKKQIPQTWKQKIIILVDDVYTTGATLRSAASVLKHAGVKTVWGLTIAQ